MDYLRQFVELWQSEPAQMAVYTALCWLVQTLVFRGTPVAFRGARYAMTRAPMTQPGNQITALMQSAFNHMWELKADDRRVMGRQVNIAQTQADTSGRVWVNGVDLTSRFNRSDRKAIARSVRDAIRRQQNLSLEQLRQDQNALLARLA